MFAQNSNNGRIHSHLRINKVVISVSSDGSTSFTYLSSKYVESVLYTLSFLALYYKMSLKAYLHY